MRVCVCQDVALPFIASDRFESDTLFLVFENDFRFRENDYPEPEVRSAESMRATGDAPPAVVAPLQAGERVVKQKNYVAVVMPPPLFSCNDHVVNHVVRSM